MNFAKSAFLPGAACAFLASSAAAAVFSPLSQSRTINIGATVSVSANDDSGFSDSASDGDGASGTGFEPMDAAVGLSGFSLFTPYGSGGGSGRASQESSMTADRIHFRGFADIFVSAVSPGDGSASASGSASSDFNFSFRIDAPVTVRLDMESAQSDSVTSEFWFSLSRDDGTTVWDQTGIEIYPNWVTDFSVHLLLEPGIYTASAHAGASSSFDSGFGFAGQTTAEFALTIVPEPGMFSLLAVSGLLMGTWHRRRRQ